jgi:hypothetical protein
VPVFAAWSNYYVDREGESHRGITTARKLIADKSKWSGHLDADNLSEIVEAQQDLGQEVCYEGPNEKYGQEIQSYQDIEELINKIICAGEAYDPSAINQISRESTKNLYEIRKENARVIAEKGGHSDRTKKYIENSILKESEPFYYEPFDAFKSMSIFAEAFGVILALIISYISGTLFLDDYRLDTKPVVDSTKNGKSKVVKARFISAFFIATALYWGLLLISSLLGFLIMGTSGANISIRVEEPYSIYSVSFLEKYILILISGYIGCIFSGGMATFASVKTKSMFASVLVPFFLFSITPFLSKIIGARKPYLNTPDCLFSLNHIMKLPGVLQIGQWIMPQTFFLLILYAILSLLISMMTYYSIVEPKRG